MSRARASGVLSLARTRRRCDPGAAFPNRFDHHVGAFVGWLLLGLVEVLDAAPDDDECANETAKHDSVQHCDDGRVRDVADAEYHDDAAC